MQICALAGDRYKLADEPGWIDPNGRKVKGAPQVIPCRNGHIYKHGSVTLGACTNQRGPVATKLARIGRLHADGDDGVTVLFSPDQFDAVAKVMLPRRRRRLTVEQRQKLVADGAKYRISSRAPRAGATGAARRRKVAT